MLTFHQESSKGESYTGGLGQKHDVTFISLLYLMAVFMSFVVFPACELRFIVAFWAYLEFQDSTLQFFSIFNWDFSRQESNPGQSLK